MSYRGTGIVAVALALLMCAGSVLSLAVVTQAEPVELRSDLPPIAEALGWSSVVSIGHDIYVIGGTKANSPGLGATYDTVQIYDVDTGVTTFGTKMPKGIAAAASGVGLDGKIYVAGGWNYSDVSYYQKVQVYDPVLDSWAETAGSIPEPIGRSASAMAADGTLYVFGGGWSSNVTLMYNTQTDVWTYGADQPVSGFDADAVVYSSTAVYVIGGAYGGASNTVRIYDPVDDRWDSAASLPSPVVFGCAILAKNGYIYEFGGAATTATSDPAPLWTVLRYSVADDVWEDSGISLGAGCDHLQVVMDAYGRSVVVGGYSGSAAVATVEAFLTLDVTGENIIQITSPQTGSVVSGVTEVQVDAVNSWGSGFLAIELFVDGVLLESRTYAVSTTFLWDTTGLADGSSHTLMVRGYNFDGTTTEDSVTVTVWSESVDQKVAAIQQQVAVLQQQLMALGMAMAEANASTMAYLQSQIAILQAALTQIGAGLATMGLEQGAAMVELNATLADLMSQLDHFQTQIDRVENKADTASTYGIVTAVLVIIVIILAVLMMIMARKKP